MSDDFLDLLLTGLGETAYMVVLSTLIALLLGLPLGIIMVVTGKGQILAEPRINKVLGTIINVIRSFPSIILIVVLLPLSRFIVGTTLGTTAAIVPISIGAAPFLARIIENSLNEVNFGKIEAAMAIGANPVTIIAKILIPEALPSLIRGVTIAVIAILGFTAIAGAIGAGGLGSLAIRFGYLRYRDDIMLATILILVVMVQGIQWGGDFVAQYISRKRYTLK